MLGFTTHVLRAAWFALRFLLVLVVALLAWSMSG
jgi:hypothetical protein